MGKQDGDVFVGFGDGSQPEIEGALAPMSSSESLPGGHTTRWRGLRSVRTVSRKVPYS